MHLQGQLVDENKNILSADYCSQIGETEASVADVLVQEVMAVEPVSFKAIIIDIDSIKVQRKLFLWLVV